MLLLVALLGCGPKTSEDYCLEWAESACACGWNGSAPTSSVGHPTGLCEDVSYGCSVTPHAAEQWSCRADAAAACDTAADDACTAEWAYALRSRVGSSMMSSTRPTVPESSLCRSWRTQTWRSRWSSASVMVNTAPGWSQPYSASAPT